MLQENRNLIFKSNNGLSLYQRANDGYVNATKLCQDEEKLFGDYARLKTTKEYLNELSMSMGIPIDQLVYSMKTRSNDNRGTWVHPKVAIHLAQWLSPQFAVFVTNIMMEWFSGAYERRKTKEEELLALLKEDDDSFEIASVAAKVMKGRQIDKPIIAEKIRLKKLEIQQDMFLGYIN